MYELSQPTCCQGGGLVMPRSMLQIWTCFFDKVFIMDQRTTGKPAWVFLFVVVRGIWPIERSEKKKQKMTTSLEKKKKIKQAFCFVCACGFKHKVEGSDQNSQNWAEHLRNSAVYDIHAITRYEVLGFGMESFCCCISWWVMNATYKYTDRLLVSSALCNSLSDELEI